MALRVSPQADCVKVKIDHVMMSQFLLQVMDATVSGHILPYLVVLVAQCLLRSIDDKERAGKMQRSRHSANLANF